MLTVTNPAGVRLTHLLETKAEDAVLRIFSRNRKFRLGVGHLRPDDRTFAHEGRVVLALGARITAREAAIEILATWLAAEFAGGRHARRVEKLAALDRAKERPHASSR